MEIHIRVDLQLKSGDGDVIRGEKIYDDAVQCLAKLDLFLETVAMHSMEMEPANILMVRNVIQKVFRISFDM